MFFRRQKARILSFSERIDVLAGAGFDVQRSDGSSVRATRNHCGAIVEQGRDGLPTVKRVGIVVGNDLAELEHGGFQMFLRTPDGVRRPALAAHLKALHAFQEDLHEALGLTSLYNTSLGTTCQSHTYDRVEDRDHPSGPKAWEN
jgi:hypothetical protein